MSDLLSDFYTEEQREVITQAQVIINGYVSNGNTIIDIWKGEKNILDSNTGEIVETKYSKNLDLYVDKVDYEIISEAIRYLNNSGNYLIGTFHTFELIAIQSRVKIIEKIVDGSKLIENKYIIQFTKQDQI